MRATTNSYRFWSPQRVGDELQHLVEDYGMRNVKFADEMFVLNRRHVEGICDEIIRRGLDLNIWAYARVDTVKEGMLPKLKQAGFNWLAFGIEAANAKVRDDVQKGFDQDDIFETLAQGLGSRHLRDRQLHLRPARGRPRHDAGDARPGHPAQLRVRQFLLPRWPTRARPCTTRRSPTTGSCRRRGAATRSTPWTRCLCPPSISPDRGPRFRDRPSRSTTRTRIIWR